MQTKSKGKEDAMQIKTNVKAGDAPVETISFNFGSMKWTYSN